VDTIFVDPTVSLKLTGRGGPVEWVCATQDSRLKCRFGEQSSGYVLSPKEGQKVSGTVPDTFSALWLERHGVNPTRGRPMTDKPNLKPDWIILLLVSLGVAAVFGRPIGLVVAFLNKPSTAA
jgi:hypothetical protein